MKKSKIYFSIISLFLICFMIAGCTNSQQKATINPYDYHITYSLNLDNVWNYVTVKSSVSAIEQFSYYSNIRQPNNDRLKYQIQGKSSCVVYENIILTFEYKVLDQYDEIITYKKYINLLLDIAGNGEIYLTTTELPSNDFPYTDVSCCKRYLALISVSGKVVF